MITRIRLEAIGDTEVAVSDKLSLAVQAMRDHAGGMWEVEDSQITTAKKGYWGRITLKRKRGRNG